MSKVRKWNTVSKGKLVQFVKRNPGLTATMIAVLWRRRPAYISSVLYRMSEEGMIDRRQEQGMMGSVRAWRYYESLSTVALRAVNAEMKG